MEKLSFAAASRDIQQLLRETFADLDSSPLPLLYRVRQRWQSKPVSDIPATVREQYEAVGLRQRIAPGMQVAITAGSRGIRDIVPVLQASVAYLREAGAQPFIVPAMGSHGGATAEGQVQLLAKLGITEATMGCPIRSSMEVVTLGHLDDGSPVFLDQQAAEADGILAINRIKTHTSFKAEVESGLAKMCAVGLGKQAGAESFHNRGVAGMQNRLVPMARMVVERGGVLAGLALLEDAAEQTADIVALPPDEIGAAGEGALLTRSKELMARLPFDHLDVLIVDEMGKNISGTGLDTNVIGRLRIPGEHDPLVPRISVIVTLDLSDASNGSAVGMGLSDIITEKLANKVNLATTYANSLTAGLIGLQRGFIPIVMPTAHNAIAMAMRVCGQPDQGAVRLARIRSTLLLDELLVTAPLLPEVREHPGLELAGEAAWEGLE